MKQKNYHSCTVGQIVAGNFDTTKVFSRYHIDFCCHGNTPFAEACRNRGIDPEALLAKVTEAHSKNHPELLQVQALFRDSLLDLENHLSKEENVLFPYVYEMFQAKEEGLKVAKFHCGTILYPIEVMEDEHNHEGERFEKISSLTNGFTAPEDACASFRLVLQQLKQFEEALHEHIHLENNIIFPRALELEKKEAI